MRNKIALGLTVVFSAFVFQSCDPWEDESYHPTGGGSDGPEVEMLLKEVKTQTGSFEGLSTYTYDGQNRLTKIISHSDITDQGSYAEITYQYPTEGKVKFVSKGYLGGELITTTSAEFEIETQTTAKLSIQDGIIGEMTSQITYSAPCGISNMVTTLNIEGSPTSTTSYTFNDANCSYTENIDGEWSETVFRDDKFSPYMDPMAILMGVISHNTLKVEESDGAVETISYLYNENGFPTSATHTFNEISGEDNYTKTFVYY